MFDNDRQAAFFFGEPLKIFGRIWHWFVGNADIYEHLWVTLVETALAFAIGTVLGLVFGLWLALSPMAAAIADPVHQGAQQHAAGHPGADLRGLVRPRRGEQGRARRDARLLHRLLQRLPGRQGSEPGRARQCPHARRVAARPAAPRLPAERDELGVQLAAHLGRPGLRRRGGRRVPRLLARRRLPDPAGRGRVRHQHRDGGHPGADRVRAAARRRGRADREAPDALAAGGRRDREDSERQVPLHGQGFRDDGGQQPVRQSEHSRGLGPLAPPRAARRPRRRVRTVARFGERRRGLAGCASPTPLRAGEPADRRSPSCPCRRPRPTA